jgi:hypothetical protein
VGKFREVPPPEPGEMIAIEETKKKAGYKIVRHL